MREFPSPQEILKVFEREPGKTFRLRELVVELGLRSSQARDLKNALKGLARHKRIVYLKKNHFALGGRSRTPRPHAAIHAANSGSRPVDDRQSQSVNARAARARGERGERPPDWPSRWLRFCGARRAAGGHRSGHLHSSDGMGSAMNGDRVEVQVLRAKPDGRWEGRILSVIDRAQKTVVGQFHCGQRYNYVLPFDHRIPFEIVIPRGEEWPGGESPAPAAQPRSPVWGRVGTASPRSEVRSPKHPGPGRPGGGR